VDGLTSRGYDYWALGHVHRSNILRDAAPAIVYPGSPQGLNPNEDGPRGCYVVQVSDDRAVSLDYRETDAVRWHIEEVDIGPMQREQDLLDALDARLDDVAARLGGGRSGLVRFQITGRGPLHSFLGKTGTAQKLHEHLLASAPALPAAVWTESVQITTRPVLDLNERARIEDFLGDFLRIADEAARDPARLSEMLEALKGRVAPSHARTLDAVGAGLDSAGAEDVAAWLRQATMLGADMLLRAEE
jgi:DNA repair exonuclease SbcCD nuclease subunit